MKLCPAVFAFSAMLLHAEAQTVPRIVVEELRHRETALRAFQQFRIQFEPEEAKKYEWSDPKKFADWHGDFRVHELRKTGEPVRYAITWSGFGQEDAWHDTEAAPALDETIRELPFERQIVESWFFSADGQSLQAAPGNHMDSLLGDFYGTGEMEAIERVREGPDAIKLITDVPVPNVGVVEYLTIHTLERDAKPSFVLLYNAHSEEAAAANTWGFRLRDVDGDGRAEIELGPVLVPRGIEPKVVFH